MRQSEVHTESGNPFGHLPDTQSTEQVGQQVSA